MSISPGPNTGGAYPSALTSGTTFYKYEPFSFTFTGGSLFSASGTLVSYCSAPGQSSITFSSTTGFQTPGSTSGETLTIRSTYGSVTYTLFINGGRFVVTPSITSIVLYQNETISNTLKILGSPYSSYSNITFTSQTQLCNSYTIPTLPSSLLTFTNPTNDRLNFVLSGSSTNISASSNYYIVGSNSSNGYVVTTTFPIQVLGERIVLVPSTTSVLLTIGSNLPSAASFSVITPLSVSTPVKFTSANLPPGMSLTSTGTIYGTPIYSNTATSYTSTVTASALGLSTLTTSSVITFAYATSVIFTSAQTASFYSNVANTVSNVAIVFPTASTITYSTTANLPSLGSGFTLNPTTGVLSGTTTSNLSIPITATSGSFSNTQTVAITTVPVTVQSVISPSSTLNYIVGQTITPVTVTFSSPAYASNFIQSVSYTGVPLGITTTPAAGTLTTPVSSVTLSGIAYQAIPTTSIIIGITTLDGTTASATLSYTFTADNFTFTSIPTPVFAFQQNGVISPIQFAATPSSGVPITYFYGANLPSGLYVTPGGTLNGTPTTAVTNAVLSGIYATNGFTTLPITSVGGSALTYTTTPDTALLVSSPVSTALSVSTTNPTITLSNQTVSGLLLSNQYFDPISGTNKTNSMSFLTYPYGLTVTPVSISATLGTCVYPTDIALPPYTTVYGTVNPNAIPCVLAISNTNPQLINRFILGQNTATASFNVYYDNGTNFGTLTTAASNIPCSLPGPHSFVINSNAPTSGNAWSGTGVIAVGSSTLTVMSSGPSFTTVSGFSSGISRCIFDTSTFNAWLAVSAGGGNFWFSSAPSSYSSWISSSVSLNSTPSDFSTPGTNPGLVAGYAIAVFSNVLLWGGSGTYPLVQSSNAGPSFPSSMRFSNVTTYPTVSNVYDIRISESIVVTGGAAFANSASMFWSTDALNWTPAVNSFTTNTSAILYGGSNLVGNSWLALGTNTTPGVSYSADGKTWISTDFAFSSSTTLGPLRFDGTYWCFFATTSSMVTLYQHDALASTMSNSSSWTSTVISIPGVFGIYAFPTPIYTITGTPKPVVYAGSTPNGPTITPSGTTYSIFQYIQITPITFTSSSSVIFFLGSALPPGMTWDATNGTIKGLCVKLGTFTVTVYAQASNGISSSTITFIVSRVQVTPRIPSAAANTSFIREKVTADSATSAINNHTTPFKVGTFLLERPPVATTAPEICCDTTVKNN